MGYGRSYVFSNCFSNDGPDILPKIAFVGIPTLKRDDYQQWKKELIGVVERYQVLKPEDHARIEKGKMFICLLHFEEKHTYLTSKNPYLIHIIFIITP